MNKKNASDCNLNNKKTQLKMNKNVKKRNWAFVGYPESLPKNWLEELKLTGLKIAVSPLHDKDLQSDDETEKKAHYHFIVCYSNTTTYNNVASLTERFNATIPQPLESIRGYYRYFTHMDDPNKYQYDSKDIICLNGFDIADYMDFTKSEISNVRKELQDIIVQSDMVEYSVFMDFVRENLDGIYYDVASNSTMFFSTYLRSRRHIKTANS